MLNIGGLETAEGREDGQICFSVQRRLVLLFPLFSNPVENIIALFCFREMAGLSQHQSRVWWLGQG